MIANPRARGFLEEFCLPLVRGGEVVIGSPLSLRDALIFANQIEYLPHLALRVDDARAGVLAELVVRPPPVTLDVDDLLLAAALHDALFLAHPRADAWTAGQRGRRRVLEAAQLLAAEVAVPEARHQILGRHALLHNLFALTRQDVRVSWWTGSASYQGQRPPTRLERMPQLRRVHREEVSVGYDELLGAGEVAAVVAAILRRSPLTALLAPGREGPPLHWEDAAFVLRDVELARAVAYGALRGAEPRAVVATPARLAAAFEQMLERAPEPADVRAVVGLLIDLNGLLALAEQGERDPARSPLLAAVLAPERAGQRPRGLATFFALPAAAAVVDPRLAVPPGIDDDPGLAARWRAHRSQVAEAVGDAVIGSLAARLRRHLGGGVLESRNSDG